MLEKSTLGRAAVVVAVALAAGPAGAWAPATEIVIAEQAARFAPRDLARQIEKHPQALRDGVLAAIANPAAGRTVGEVLATEVERAVDAIRNHRPFAEVVQRLGQVAHYVALANDPLAVGSDDPHERRYAGDYARYVESARPRFQATFYGDGRRVEQPAELTWLVRRAFARGRSYYPLIGNEYRRIGYREGRKHFDDRSTAYGLAALAFSHSISDTIGVLRYIWLRAGGADPREFLDLTPPASP
ncbi:MAG: hypothetical protein OES32_20065 [Acidobacteriota bacterium]|nr:hypothetical protein [Acidobacteriota bacterium]